MLDHSDSAERAEARGARSTVVARGWAGQVNIVVEVARRSASGRRGRAVLVARAATISVKLERIGRRGRG